MEVEQAQNRKAIFYLVAALIFTDSVLYGTIVPLIPFYTKQFHFTTIAIGAVFAAYALGLLLFSIPMGIVAERYGYKRVFMVGMFVLTISFIFYDMITSPEMLFIARLIQGIAGAATWTAGLAIVAILYPNQVGQKIGLLMAAMGVGNIMGPPIGGVLYKYFGYRAMFTVLALICFSLFLLICKTKFAKRTGMSGDGQNFRLSKVKDNMSLFWLCVVVIFSCSSFGMLEILLPNRMDARFGMDTLQIGLFFGGMGLIHAISDAVVGSLSDRYGFSVFVFWGLITGAACLPLLALAPSVALLFIAMGIAGITIGAALVPSQPLMHQIVADDANFNQNGGAGFAYGLFNTCFSMGLIIGPLLGGTLNKYLGFMESLLIYGCLFILSAVIFRCKVIGVCKSAVAEGK